VITSRRLAIAAGLLFLVADVAGFASRPLAQVLSDNPDFLGEVPGHATQLGWASLFVVVMAAAGAGISVAFYPILRQLNAALAIGSVVFRTAEAILLLTGAAILMSIIGLGQRSVGAADPAWYGNAAKLLLDVHEQVNLVALLAFSIGALFYYCVFFQSRILPRWLSGWGILGTVVWMAGVSWAIVAHSPENALFLAPLALNELVVAIWLICRGFSSTEPASKPAPAAAPSLIPSPTPSAA
jgi:hypothetical protein